MKRGVFLIVGVLGLLLLPGDTAHANSLKIAPLEYRATLAEGEVKKGFVDISNPEYKTISVELDVLGFRQTDDNGTIEFFEDEQIAAGIQLDFDEVTLQPREAYRVYFLLDGSKLPSGDVFGAIFARTVPDSPGSAEQAVRVGTLVMLENKTPGARDAEITDLSVGFLQFGSGISGSYTVKNTADSSQATGFFPEVSLAVTPLRLEQTATSSLVFAGRERSNEFQIDTERFGLYRVTASFGDSSQSRWVLILNQWALVTLLAVGVLGYLVYRFVWSRRSKLKISRRK